MVFFDDAARTSRGLVLACVDCARFDPADPLARVLALASAAPYAMVMCAAAMAYATRNRALALVFLAGCANEALSLLLKRVIKQPRPAARCVDLGTCGKFGMPSSHTQSVVFAFLVHLLLRRRLLVSLPSKKSSSSSPLPLPLFLFEGLALALAAAVVAWARVYLGYHSWEQVAAGAALGAAAAVATAAAVARDHEARRGAKAEGGKQRKHY